MTSTTLYLFPILPLIVASYTYQCSYYSVQCSYYSCPTVSCSFSACSGDTVSLSTCDSYSGNTYLSLYSSSYGTLASNDDYCGYGSALQYTIPYSGCRTYYAYQSCSAGYYNSCSGYTKVIVNSVPTVIPTPSPSRIPTYVPSNKPSTHPTATPTVGPTKMPTTMPSTHPTNPPTIVPTCYPTVSPTLRPTSYPTSPTMSPTQYFTAECPPYSTVGASRPAICTITTALCPGDNFTASTCSTAVGDTILSLVLDDYKVATGDDGCGVVAGGSLLSWIVTEPDCALYTIHQMCYANKPCRAITKYSILRIGNNLPEPKKRSQENSESLNTGVIVGISVGLTVAVCFFILISAFFVFRMGTTYRKFQEFQDLQEHPVGILDSPVSTNNGVELAISPSQPSSSNQENDDGDMREI